MSAYGVFVLLWVMVFVLLRVICLSMMCVNASMCFHGLLGAVVAVRVSNTYRWSAASVVRMSGSEPIWRPLSAYWIVRAMGTVNAPSAARCGCR